jgi:hypothetical protein
MKTDKMILVIMVSCTFTGNSYAISKEKHPFVTREAIKAYTSCIEQLGVEDTLNDGSGLIVESTEFEDEFSLTRYFNWHFYDAFHITQPKFSMGKSITGARKSLHYIYNERINSLIESIENKTNNDVYEFTGRVLHYIQDMTVPAHVAPIYHYKIPLIDRSDFFDSMPEWKTAIFNPPKDLCNIKVTNIHGLNDYANKILEETAQDTIRHIQELINVPEEHELNGKTWEEFWIVRKPENDESYSGVKYGFSPYGKKGRNGFEKLCSADKDTCLGFFQESYDAAITSTVKVLLYINAVNTRL